MSGADYCTKRYDSCNARRNYFANGVIHFGGFIGATRMGNKESPELGSTLCRKSICAINVTRMKRVAFWCELLARNIASWKPGMSENPENIL